jgi:hypothetical protein
MDVGSNHAGAKMQMNLHRPAGSKVRYPLVSEGEAVDPYANL